MIACFIYSEEILVLRPKFPQLMLAGKRLIHENCLKSFSREKMKYRLNKIMRFDAEFRGHFRNKPVHPFS
jgi:hypothetical protein